MVKLLIIAAIALLAGMPARAQVTCPTTQTSPNFAAGGSVFGRIADQWNAYFRAKADANDGVLCNPTIVGGTADLLVSCEGLTDGGTACTANTGTSGNTVPLLDGNNVWSGTQTFAAVLGTIKDEAGTAYELVAADCGKMIRATAASAAIYTVPNSLPAGCHVSIMQTTAGGQVTIAAGSGATFNANPHGYTKTFGQWAVIAVAVDTNVGGTAATFTLLGDGA